METGLIAALAKAAKEAREEKGVSLEEVAVTLGTSTDKVRRFERAITFGALGEIVAAYSETTGVSLPDLLDEAKSNLKNKG